MVKYLKVDHLGIAVPRLEEAVAAYQALGFTLEAVHEVPSEGVRTAFLPAGGTHLELLEPTGPASPVARFLEKRSGLHHVCVAVADIAEAVRELREKGVPFVGEAPRPGAGGCLVAFVHPRAAGGVLLELKQEVEP
jgi:methylmalonyl-CoA/ethylmalonyl-CoA epimerase